jgi:hypothetical protein
MLLGRIHAGAAGLAICGCLSLTLFLERSVNASLVRASHSEASTRLSVPSGWGDFCRRHDRECDVTLLPPLG